MSSIKRNLFFAFLILLAAQLACGTNTPNDPTEPPLPIDDNIATEAPAIPTATTAPVASPTPEFPLGYEEVLVFGGTWEGEWRNTTYGSSGAMSVSCEPAMDGTISCISDIDGMVFGFIDPEPQEFSLLYDQNGIHINLLEDPLFGNISGTVSFDGEFTGLADLIPDPGIVSMALSGVLTPESMIGNYQIEFFGSGGATGEIQLHKVSD